MSRRRAEVAGVDILEWRPSGHRMTYVAAIVQSAGELGLDVALWTTPEVLETSEFQTQLSPFISNGQLTIRSSAQLRSGRGLLRVLSEIRKQGRGAVVPEADRYLHLLLVALATRRLPYVTTAIVMRPPTSVGGRWRGRVGSVVKTSLILSLVHSRRLDVQLLEDPLAEGKDRVWRWPLDDAKLRLGDPCSLLNKSLAQLPSELRCRSEGRAFLAVVGVIDDRKNVPLILDAWRLSDAPNNCDLVIAGKQSQSVSAWLASEVALPENTTIVDRYLSEAEIRSVLEHSRGIFALYDGGLSSGLVVAAAALGRWVITLEGSRTGRVASRHGFGVSCAPTPSSLAGAACEVLAKTSVPVPVVVPSSRDFGRRVLRRLVEARDDT